VHVSRLCAMHTHGAAGARLWYVLALQVWSQAGSRALLADMKAFECKTPDDGAPRFKPYCKDPFRSVRAYLPSEMFRPSLCAVCVRQRQRAVPVGLPVYWKRRSAAHGPHLCGLRLVHLVGACGWPAQCAAPAGNALAITKSREALSGPSPGPHPVRSARWDLSRIGLIACQVGPRVQPAAELVGDFARHRRHAYWRGCSGHAVRATHTRTRRPCGYAMPCSDRCSRESDARAFVGARLCFAVSTAPHGRGRTGKGLRRSGGHAGAYLPAAAGTRRLIRRRRPGKSLLMRSCSTTARLRTMWRSSSAVLCPHDAHKQGYIAT
jgi:hypothetical protein